MAIILVLEIASVLAGIGLAILLLLIRRFGPASWMLSFVLLPASLSVAAFAFGPGNGLQAHESTLRLSFAFLILMVPGGILSAHTIDRAEYRCYMTRKRLSVAALLAAAPILAISLYLIPGPAALAGSAPEGALLGPAAYMASLYLLLSSIVVLARLEQTLRNAEEHVRWEIKFLVLGLAGIFSTLLFVAANVSMHPYASGFYSPSAFVLFPILLLLSCTLIFMSWRRTSGYGRVVVSQRLVYSSIVLIGLVVYIVVSSLITRTIRRWAEPQMPIGALVYLLAALLLLGFFLTTAFRQRLRTWIRRNLLAGRYDYRLLWLEAADSIHSIHPLPQSAASLVELIQRVVGGIDVSVWLRTRHPNRLRLLAARGSIAYNAPQEVSGVVEKLLQQTEPISLEENAGNPDIEIDSEFLRQTQAILLYPLSSSRQCVGLLTVGADRTGKPYDWQTREFLQVLASYAAAEFHKSELLANLVENKEMEAFRTFSTFLLHDLKNFASTLSLIAKNASRHQDNPEFQSDAFRSVFETAEKMMKLCSNLGSFSATPAPVKRLKDLNQIILSVADNLHAGPAIRLRLELEEIPLAMVDAEKVGSVIRNLLLNAFDAVIQGGSILVTTHAHDAEIEIGIADDGIGMTSSFVKNDLFRPFHTTKSDGLGIGLYQSKKIVEAHDGTIHVESEPGKGTTVRFTIPRAPSQYDSVTAGRVPA
jgi:putative PEP-CTERM system histidine kinase